MHYRCKKATWNALEYVDNGDRRTFIATENI